MSILIESPPSTGSSLASQLSEALKECALHCALFAKLGGLDEENIKAWEELVTTWEYDQMKPSPFKEVKNSTYISHLGANKISLN